MRPTRFWLTLAPAALLLLLAGACSDSGSNTPAADATVDSVVADAPSTPDTGSKAPDLAAAGELGPPDAAAKDQNLTDGVLLGDTVGPPASSLPTKITQLVNLGDSLAYGYPASKGMSYKELLLKNDDTKYPTWKGKDLTTRFPGITLVDKGTIGAMSGDLAKQVSGLTGNATGDTLVLISIGGNDFSGAIIGLAFNPAGAKTLATTVTGNIAKALTHFADKKLYPGKVAVVLLNVFDPTDGAGIIPSQTGLSGFCTVIQLAGPLVGKGVLNGMATFNNELGLFAQKAGVMLANHHDRFLGHGYNYSDTKNKYYDAKDATLWFYSDCIHANERGYHEMRGVVWERITGSK